MNNRLKTIGKALKSVLMSIFHMNYQIAEEKEDVSKIPHRKRIVTGLKVFKLAFIVLTIATIVWIIIFYTFREYFCIMGIALSAGWLGFIVVAIEKFLERRR